MSDEKQLGNYRFIIEIEGVQAGAFRSFSGLSTKNEVIEYRRGGDRTVRRRPGRIHFSNLVLEKGFTTSTDLFDWQETVRRGEAEKKSGSLIILDHDGSEQRRYNFHEAWPVSWEAPGMVAGAGETAVEKIEIAVENVELG